MDTPTATLDKFHLGVSADGKSCMMIFVDEEHHIMRCVADFSEFNAFIASLTRVAGEMARRRSDGGEEQGPDCGTLNVAFAEFRKSPTDDSIEGALVGDAGQIVGIRMCPEVACQIGKAILMATPPASRC